MLGIQVWKPISTMLVRAKKTNKERTLMKDNLGCILGGIGVLVVAILGGFWLHSATTTHRINPGYYGVVIRYSTDGTKDVKVYPGGYQYTVEWGSNVKDFEYQASVQTIKLFRSTTEGQSNTPDDIYC